MNEEAPQKRIQENDGHCGYQNNRHLYALYGLGTCLECKVPRIGQALVHQKLP